MGEPVFGCPRCRTYPNPREDELCLDCTRAKLAYLNALHAQNGAPAAKPGKSAGSRAGGILFRIIKGAFIGGGTQKKGLRQGWYFFIAFILFFLFMGRGMMMNSFNNYGYGKSPPQSGAYNPNRDPARDFRGARGDRPVYDPIDSSRRDRLPGSPGGPAKGYK